MRFDASYWELFSRNLKNFSSTPRKINAIIPALTVYVVWSIGIAYSNVLGFSPGVDLYVRQFLAIASSVFTLVFIHFWSKIILKRKNLSFWPIEYLGTIAIGVLPILLYWLLIYEASVISLLLIYVRMIFLTVVAESIVGFLIFQIQNRSRELEQHQISLVTYEEKFRSTIFNHLHDKVQSRLFSVGIQLNEIKSDLDSDYSKKVEDIISQIEKIRLSDVKKTSIEIVPPITSVGLTPSILSLLKSHKPVLAGRFSSQLSTPLSDVEEDHFGIGIYRIIEQSLINSLIHGKATECDVVISQRDADIVLAITNNGILFDVKHITQGHGFAVIDGWVSKLKGEWNISNVKDQVRLEARFERQISQV